MIHQEGWPKSPASILLDFLDEVDIIVTAWLVWLKDAGCRNRTTKTQKEHVLHEKL